MKGNRFVARHLESNRQSRDAWARFAPHRAHVTSLVMAGLATGGSVCILGAGNLNDVDLSTVLRRARSVDLVDLDDDAMDQGLRRQHLAGDGRARRHPGWDLSGVLHLLGTGAGVGELLRAVDRPWPAPPEAGFDVVLSAGVLTQLFQSAVDAGLPHDATVEVTVRLRARHLREVNRLARPGGHAILVTDTLPTSTAPWLRDVEPAELEPAMASAVAAGNFFTGTNPYRLVAVLEEHDDVEGVTLHEPWLWPVTADRDHLTYAVSWRRSGPR